jgi:hypothetical protein
MLAMLTYAAAVIVDVTSGQSVIDAIQAAGIDPLHVDQGAELMGMRVESSVTWTDPTTSATYTCAAHQEILGGSILDWTPGGDVTIIAYFGRAAQAPSVHASV